MSLSQSVSFSFSSVFSFIIAFLRSCFRPLLLIYVLLGIIIVSSEVDEKRRRNRTDCMSPSFPCIHSFFFRMMLNSLPSRQFASEGQKSIHITSITLHTLRSSYLFYWHRKEMKSVMEAGLSFSLSLSSSFSFSL